MKTKTKVLYLGSADLVNRFADIFDKNGIQILLLDRTHMDTEEVVQRIQTLIADEDIKGVIGFGRMLAELRPRLQIPIVELKHTYYSYVSAYRVAQAIDKKVGMIVWKSTEEIGLDQFLIDYRDKVEIVEENDYIKNDIKIRNALWEKGLTQLQEKGYRVCLGSAIMADFAKRYNIVVVPVGLDIESVLYTISDLKNQIHIFYDQRIGYEQMQTMLDRINEGVIAVNLHGDILDINEKGLTIFGLGHTQEDRPRKLKDIVSEADLRKMLNDKIKLENYITTINHTNVIVNSIATYYKELKENGYILTIQEISGLHNLVHDIQSKVLKKNLYAKHTFQDILGQSAAITRAKKQAARYASANSTVLIEGDTGSGKELFAQSIHNASVRKDMPFVAINCAALPENLLESELFGYVKGAFTGARSEGKPGLFEMANHGTIFLDEIGEISPQVQARLLRVLQEREVSRLGDDKVIRVDVRVIAATNRNLYKETQTGKFREDLYYRLCVLELWIPSLKERREDIPLLLSNFLKAHGRPGIQFTSDASDALQTYNWPGNIRELVNFTDRLCVMSDNDLIDEEMIKNLLSRRGCYPGEEKAPTSSTYSPEQATPMPTNFTSIENQNSDPSTMPDLLPYYPYLHPPYGCLRSPYATPNGGYPGQAYANPNQPIPTPNQHQNPHPVDYGETYAAGSQVWQATNPVSARRHNRYTEAEIRDVLQRHRGNRQATAAELGVSTVTLWRWMKETGIKLV